MNRPHSFLIGLLLVGSTCLFTASGARAGTTATKPAAAVSNTVPASVFEDTVTAGKDPFFPRSRRRTMEASAAVAGVTADISSLVLQGVSATAKKPLATINNQSFTAGEEGEVVTPSGRVRIRCEEIRPDSVVVYLGAQRLELRLPQR